MTMATLKLVFVKLGFLGSTLLPEALLDERASRKEITVRSLSAGCRMEQEDGLDIAWKALSYTPNLVILIAPALTQPGPQAALEVLCKGGLPIIAVTDLSSSKILSELESKDIGYILFEADSLIGARFEYLDPVETAMFNSDILKVLAVSGASRLLQEEIDAVISSLKKRQKILPPKLLVDAEMAVKYAKFSNPYAEAKAIASYTLAATAGSLSLKGCYQIKERERYLPIVASAHEVMRIAAILADEAREIEKGEDKVLRKMHLENGSVKQKKGLLDKLSAKS